MPYITAITANKSKSSAVEMTAELFTVYSVQFALTVTERMPLESS